MSVMPYEVNRQLEWPYVRHARLSTVSEPSTPHTAVHPLGDGTFDLKCQVVCRPHANPSSLLSSPGIMFARLCHSSTAQVQVSRDDLLEARRLPMAIGLLVQRNLRPSVTKTSNLSCCPSRCRLISDLNFSSTRYLYDASS